MLEVFPVDMTNLAPMRPGVTRAFEQRVRRAIGPLGQIAPVDLGPHGHRFETGKQAQVRAQDGQVEEVGGAVNFEKDVASTTDEPEAAECPQEPEARDFAGGLGAGTVEASVDVDGEVADGVRDPLAG